jgi:hypothetical protein
MAWLSTQILKLSDGGEVCLDWIDNGHKDGDSAPIVLFLPGTEPGFLT